MNYRDNDPIPEIQIFTPMNWFAKYFNLKGYVEASTAVYIELQNLEII